MREILFRGRDTHGVWQCGDYIRYDDEMCNITDTTIYRHAHLCNTETVGQYTGLTDKNGTKIFEGDICKSKDNENYLIKIGSFIPLEFYSVFKYAEQYIIDKMAIYGVYAEKEGEDFVIPEINSFVILGNIHDNPELLKNGQGA